VGEGIVNIDQWDALQRQAQRYSLDQIKEAIYRIGRAVEELRLNANPRLVLEVLMLDLP
jgi:DNA polymerase III gamma/tau subunit